MIETAALSLVDWVVLGLYFAARLSAEFDRGHAVVDRLVSKIFPAGGR